MQLHNKTLLSTALAFGTILCVGGGSIGVNAQETQSGQPTTTAPDNSRHNKAHRTTPTADQQSEHVSDRTLTQNIRKALIADKSLSTYGHNVKIITLNGAVTLKGPVHSEEEKQSIAAKAAEVAGADKVTNNLTVK